MRLGREFGLIAAMAEIAWYLLGCGYLVANGIFEKMVMARRTNKVCVPFQPLLEKIVAWLQFPPPFYGFIDVAKNNAFVRVGRPNTRARFLFCGGDASSAEESRERAAHKAVKH
uniref:Uncharacterized protein n=1 Tax=Chenopodium quinoa TaxID=63459 RepID=A0A803KV32_CHEQI